MGGRSPGKGSLFSVREYAVEVIRSIPEHQDLACPVRYLTAPWTAFQNWRCPTITKEPL